MRAVFRAGDAVTWWRRNAGGGTTPVRATVLAVTPRRVKILAGEGAGPSVRYVTRERLRPRGVPEDLGAVSEPVASLLGCLAAKATQRQLRLFATACCRAEWGRFTERASRAAVLTAERFADGLASLEELDTARAAAYRAREAGAVYKLAADAAKRDARQAASLVVHVASYAGEACDRRLLLEVLWDVFGNTPFRGLSRTAPDSDVFGNEFRPVAFDPSWRTPSAVAVAAATYESRDFRDVPVLGDALEEAGCDVPRVLAHCRGGRHGRGCWVIDAVLGRS